MLIPTRRRTWGLRGRTPTTRYNYQHGRISALAALSVSARRKQVGLYIRFQQDNFTAVHVANFLRALLQHLRGPVILLWDRGRIHKGSAVGELRGAYPRLQVEWFPAYAPELNPVEQVWNDFRGHDANRLFRDKRHIRQTLHADTRRVRRSATKLRSFLTSSDLPEPLAW